MLLWSHPEIKFRNLCRYSGLSKDEFAKLCGFSQADLNRCLVENLPVPQEIFEKVMKAKGK